MLGAITGNIIGSGFAFKQLASYVDDFQLFSKNNRFTGATVMTLAVADALRRGYGKDGLHDMFIDAMHAFGNARLMAGYGHKFTGWLIERRCDPYNSFGAGSAMRVSPVGWIAKSLAEAECLAAISAGVTHNHPEGIMGAQAVAGAIFLARTGTSREDIRQYLTEKYGYDLSHTIEEIRKANRMDVNCRIAVSRAVTAFLESRSFMESVRKAIWIGGNSAAQAAIAGSIAEAFYGEVPKSIATMALEFLDDELYKIYLMWSMWLHKEIIWK